MTYSKASPDNKVQLVSICAWCQKEYSISLKKDVHYTHGICGKHKEEIIHKVRFHNVS